VKDTILKTASTLFLAIIAVCVVIITVKVMSSTPCETCPNGKPSVTQTTTTAENNRGSAPTTPTTTEPTVAQTNSLLVDTPYGALRFPKEHEPYTVTSVTDQNGVYAVRFSYKNAQGEWELYTVCFGDAQQGQLFGTVGNGVPFTIRFSKDVDETQWNEDDMLRVSAMREAVNDIIQSVERFEGYMK